MVSIKNLRFEYYLKHKKTLKVIDELNITFDKGKLITLIGPSGCGKTTLLKLIGNLIKENEGLQKGNIFIDGSPPALFRRNKGYGIAFQNPVLLPWLNILKNISLPLFLMGIENAIERARNALSLLRMEKYGDFFPHQLSGGMIQRANLARALILNPKLLLLDEPLGALDPLTRHSIMSEITEDNLKRGVTTILVTHDILEASIFSDIIILLNGPPLRIEKIYESELLKKNIKENKYIISDNAMNLLKIILKDIFSLRIEARKLKYLDSCQY